MKDDCFSVYGYCFSLRTDQEEARDAFSRLYREFREWPAAIEEVEAVLEGRNDGFLWRLGERSVAASNLKCALWGLEAALCEAIIRSQRHMVAVHAATLYSESSPILLVGPSRAGKSTLTMALGGRGLEIASDDVTLVDPETLAVHPIPRCFHLDENSVGLLKDEGVELPEVWRNLSFLTPNDLDIRSRPRCKVDVLIYLAGRCAVQPSITRTSQAEMAARLLSETGKGPLSDPETIRVLGRLASGAVCFTLVPGPLARTAEMVVDVLTWHRENSMAVPADQSEVVAAR